MYTFGLIIDEFSDEGGDDDGGIIGSKKKRHFFFACGTALQTSGHFNPDIPCLFVGYILQDYEAGRLTLTPLYGRSYFSCRGGEGRGGVAVPLDCRTKGTSIENNACIVWDGPKMETHNCWI